MNNSSMDDYGQQIECYQIKIERRNWPIEAKRMRWPEMVHITAERTVVRRRLSI